MCSGLGIAQSQGTYRPTGAPPAQWRVNEHHALIWNQTPYLPVGVRVSTIAGIKEAFTQGIRDVVLDLPASGVGWSDLLAACEAGGMRYLIALNSVTPIARGFAVEPEAFRVSGIVSDINVDVPLPGAVSALVVLVTKRDGMIHLAERHAIENGRLKMPIKAPNSLEHILLIYPETTGLATPDYWEGFDIHRDLLLSSLTKHATGPGLRGIINPVGEALQHSAEATRFVPNSTYFRMEFRAYLTERYRSIETLVKAWSISASDIESWDHAARLVPLWTESRGVPRLWDTDTDRLYVCESKRSSIWNDIRAVVSAASSKRVARLIPAIRSVADVPVVQEWTNWSPLVEGSKVGISGVGMRTRGTNPSSVVDSGCRALSSVLRNPNPLWFVATDAVLSGVPDPASKVVDVCEDLAALGAKGWFVRSSDTPVLTAVSTESKTRSVDTSFAQWSPTAVFFAESAMNPAMPQRLPGGKWWLPSPASGSRLDLGSQFNGYRYSGGLDNYVVLWTNLATAKHRFRFIDPKVLTVTTLDGSDPVFRTNKRGFELTIGQTPLILKGSSEIPVPESALNQLLADFDRAKKLAEETRKDVTEEIYQFRDAANGFDRNPGGSWSAMNTSYHRMVKKLSLFDWIEGESSKNNSFSDIQSDPGLSNAAALWLRTQIAPNKEGFFAEYTVVPRTTEEQHLWIAAKISSDDRTAIRVDVGDQRLQIEGEPVSHYGSGYSWYDLGPVRISGPQAKIIVRVLSSETAPISLDTVLLYPGQFQPRGPMMPRLL